MISESSHKRWKIAIASLKAGEKLSYDLYDDLGELLIAAGEKLTQAAINHLDHRKIRWLIIDEDDTVLQSNEQTSPSEKLGQYDRKTVEVLDMCFEDTVVALSEAVSRLLTNQEVCTETFEQSIRAFAKEATSDIAVVLASTMSKHASPDAELSNILLRRAVKFSLLTTTICVAMGRSPNDTTTAALAALFHDSAFFLPEIQSEVIRADNNLSGSVSYLQHPIRSSRLSASISGISSLALLLITQVHEELDGKGFPLGIAQARIHPLARILSVADIYLQLTEPVGSRNGIVPADAMNCLLYHASQGTLCMKVVRAFVGATAIYPVGSEVLLENDSHAVVLRSWAADVTRPAVAIKGEPNKILDLRRSCIGIVAPLINSSDSKTGRLRASMLKEPVWRYDNSSYIVFPKSTAKS